MFEVYYFDLLLFVISNQTVSMVFYLYRLDYLTMSRQGIIVIRHMEALTSQTEWVINLIVWVMKAGSSDSRNAGMSVTFKDRLIYVFPLINGFLNLVYFAFGSIFPTTIIL